MSLLGVKKVTFSEQEAADVFKTDGMHGLLGEDQGKVSRLTFLHSSLTHTCTAKSKDFVLFCLHIL